MSASMASSRSSSGGGYFFYIEGLPKKYTWQDLKDLIRNEASHGIWTDMAIYPNGQTGGKGHARVQRRDEAGKLYRYLTGNVIEGRQLRVHLWDISGQEAQFIRCNCEAAMSNKHSTQGYPAQAVEVNRMSRTPGWQMVSPTVSAQPAYQVAPPVQYAVPPVPQPAAIDPTTAALAQCFRSLQILDRGDPAYANVYQQYQALRAQQQMTTQQSTGRPVYAVAPNGIPTNTSQGVVRTECRGIFISGLSYKAQPKEVKALFSRAGEITKCEVRKDGQTGRPKGHATIQYTSAREAQQAINMFHGKTYMDMPLKVRSDKEGTAISPPPASQANRTMEPIIVNGSQIGSRA